MEGDVTVFGSNGPVGQHNSGNTGSPVVVVGRKGSHGKLQYSPSPVFAIDTTYFIDSTCTQAHIRWLFYALSTLELDKIGQDVGVPGLSREYAYSRRLRLPSHNEQRAIADYLDTETGHIDTLITKKRRMLELLEERRSNYVSEAVTVGLDTRFRPVATGNRYAPQIPKTWRLMRLRHAIRQIIDTPHKTAPVVDDENYLVVRTSNVKKGRLVLDDARYTDRASWLEWNRRGKPRPGDVMFTREAPAGEACVVPAAIPLCIGQRMVLFRVNRSVTCGEWVVHSIYSGPAQRFIEDLSRSTIVAHLNMSDIRDIPIVVPDLSEQKEILAHIRAAVRRQELTVAKLQKQIDLLAERRQAVITAAVTGRLAVPGIAA